MTRKKFKDPSMDQWFIELESVITHEILSYIVDRRAVEEGHYMWSGLAFIDTLSAGVNCAFEYLDELMNVENDYEAIELESLAGSNLGLHQAERFLEEKDFLIQVIDKSDIQELSYDAQLRLSATYPLAKETIKHYMKELNNYDLPSCLRSLKLNEDFRINDLWEDNCISEIIKYHLHLIEKSEQHKPAKLLKPKLATSIKRSQYIDIFVVDYPLSSKKDRELELVTIYKWGIINELEEPHKSKVLSYCNDLIQTYIAHLYNCNDSKLTPEYASLPVPPPPKRFVRGYDGYLPLLIGLYCIKNEHRYKKIKDREFEVEFKSYRDFLEKELFVKFDYLRERYESWRKQEERFQAVDLKFYIDNVLSRAIKANINSVKSLIKKIEEEYFSSNT